MSIVNRWYCSLAEAKAAATATTTGADAELKRHIRSASRWIERRCGAGGALRAFIPYLDTKLFDFQFPRILNLRNDLLAVAVLTNGDGSVLTPSDYFLYPANESPKRWIELSRSAASFCYDGDPRQAISITGKFGYIDGYEENVDTVENETEISISGTSLEVTTLGSFSVGQTLLIEEEAVFVTAVGDSDLTIQRGDNGTTAVSHANGTTIHIYSPPEDIMLCTRALAARWLQRTAAAWSEATGTPEAGFLVTARIPTEIADMIRNYVRFTF